MRERTIIAVAAVTERGGAVSGIESAPIRAEPNLERVEGWQKFRPKRLCVLRFKVAARRS